MLPASANARNEQPWPRPVWTLLLLALTAATLCIHGYHPLSEDGGLYVAGIEYLLDHTLFPHYTAFVQEHLRFSLFAPAIAAIVRTTHLSLICTLFLLYLFSIWLTLFAAHKLLRAVIPASTPSADRIQLAGLALFAAWFTLPVAGTSLLLMDPYLTARSFSTPLTLLAIAFALEVLQKKERALLSAFACIALAATLHPLMATYAAAFVTLTICARTPLLSHRSVTILGMLFLLAILAATFIQTTAPAESSSLHAAILTRYYWFLSQWQWFELLGLAGPLVVFAALLRCRAKYFAPAFALLCRAAISAGVFSILIAALFARENLASHRLASLQPLRLFLPIYAIMALLLGAAAQQALESHGSKFRLILAPIVFTLAAIMLFVQRQTYTTSPQVELPWRTNANTNPWVRAFLWARAKTPRDALFALDAKYVNRDGEDAQTFRATALRSALPDYSKDGGEASITPALASQWQAASAAQQHMSQLDDATRNARLAPFHVTWLVLDAAASTSDPCPYNNGVVKVCALPPH